MHVIKIDFIFYRTEDGQLVPTRHVYRNHFYKPELNYKEGENLGTYESTIDGLIRAGFLVPLGDPHLRYNLVFGSPIWETNRYPLHQPVFQGTITLREGQTLRSHRSALMCAVSIEIVTPPPEKKPDSPSPSLEEEINAFLTSPEVGIFNLIGTTVTITTALIVVLKSWSKKDSTDSASSQEHPSQHSELDIVAIRLVMSHGPEEKIPPEWVTDPERLKHWIDVLNDPSGAVKPLIAVFEKRNGTKNFITVSEGAQHNPQLDELLSFLNTDITKK